VPSFVILTTKANPSIEIHHRMPLVIPEKSIYNWIKEENYAMGYLEQEMHQLIKTPV